MRCKIMTLLIVLALFTGIASAYDTNDLNSNGPEPLIKVAAATGESIVDNLDGTYTYTQTVDESSTAPHYTAPANGGGFGIYSWMDQDYGWMHTLDPTIYADPNLTINSVQIVIRAWDVDAEPEHGLEGEYDHVTADGVDMNPVYLQGTDDTWSTTTFDVNPSLLLNDGALDMWIDIDMYDTDSWATTLEYSKLIVTYSTDGSNHIPYEPVVEKSPAYCVDTNDNLVVDVTGPNPADPDEDAVTYKYRWYVDVGTGGYLDDDFALGIDHTGNTVPAADTSVGEKWMVQVTPVDAYGAQGPMVEVEFETIVRECGEEEIPEFPTLVLPIAAIIGIALVFQRRKNE